MSETTGTPITSGIELKTSSEPNPAIPTWLSEALLLGEYWRTTGLLERLQHQVKVTRGRMGQYEVCDFVLLLLAYAVSGASTLADFFAALNPVQSVLMAVWNRSSCPVASTLSRFLAVVDDSALEPLRGLFETDLREHGFSQTLNGGLIDRLGLRYWVFDIDGTRQAARQRSLANSPASPPPRRRSSNACAKGYLGRLRGQVGRTRSAVAQAHTSEWLGTYGAPGNGTPGIDLQRAIECIQRYLQHHQLQGHQAIVRLDGYYGRPTYINCLQQHQLGYILRSQDYQLLQYRAIQESLEKTEPQLWQHPETSTCREVFDLGRVEDTWAGYTQPVRLIAVRTPRVENRKPSVGKVIGESVYELFVTSHSPEGLNAVDVLSLYYGRGGFEKMLGDEDKELECDRWCSWQPKGQEFWQILSQWVWNWRVWSGWQQQRQPMRQTLWRPSPPDASTSATTSTNKESVPPSLLTLSPVEAASLPETASHYGPMQVSTGWARSLGKFSGDDFTIINERSLLCPAGNTMYRREVRQNRLGDLLILFGINPRTCQQCPLKAQCLAAGSAGTGGRRITVIRKKLPQATIEGHSTPSLVADVACSSASIVTPPLSPSPPSLPVLWLDLPATQLRRGLVQQLQGHQLRIEPEAKPSETVCTIPLMTRDRRAHRRLTWSERLARNAKDTLERTGVYLFGIPPTLMAWLDSLKPGDFLRA